MLRYARMAFFEQLLARAGYVKLSRHGLVLAPDGRVLPVQAAESEGGSGDRLLDWNAENATPFAPAPRLAPMPVVAAAVAMAPAVHAPVSPRVDAAPAAPAPTDESDEDEDEEEWEWQLALARAKVAAAEAEAAVLQGPPPTVARVDAAPPARVDARRADAPRAPARPTRPPVPPRTTRVTATTRPVAATQPVAPRPAPRASVTIPPVAAPAAARPMFVPPIGLGPITPTLREPALAAAAPLPSLTAMSGRAARGTGPGEVPSPTATAGYERRPLPLPPAQIVPSERRAASQGSTCPLSLARAAARR